MNCLQTNFQERLGAKRKVQKGIYRMLPSVLEEEKKKMYINMC